jgi:hypothetical protein
MAPAVFADTSTSPQTPPSNAQTSTNSPQTAAATKDFGQLSKDGNTAIRDVSLARLAIFNGQTQKAQTYVSEAQAELNKAKNDDTVFTKAEADLKTPAGVKQLGPGASPSTTPVSWIPVDGSMTLDENYVATPEKSAGVAKANEQLKNGQHNQALETLKLANVDVSFIAEVVPLNTAMNDVNQAAQLIGSGKYYEANQALKGVEDSIRYDVSDYYGTPKNQAQASSATPENSTKTR